MKIVTLEWFEQSLERGMVLDESLYSPTLPAEERGKEAWIRLQHPSPAPGKRSRAAEQLQPLNPNRRKLRRAASTKLGIQGDALWAEITTQTPDLGKNEEDDWREDNLFKHITPHQDSPTTFQDDDAVERVEPHNANAATPAAAAPKPPELVQGQGIFQGRLVVTHGFTPDKVSFNKMSLDVKLTSSPD